MKIRIKILWFSMLIVMISCDEKRIFDEYLSVGNSWDIKKSVTFDLPKLEPTKKYNFFATLRANSDYPYSNIFLIIKMQQPNKKTLVDTLEYEMANENGAILGDGFSDVKESKLVYKINEQLKLNGKYQIKIQQAVRQTGKIEGDKQLKGITEVGFRIEKTN